jgi:hypothetical protein
MMVEPRLKSSVTRGQDKAAGTDVGDEQEAEDVSEPAVQINGFVYIPRR